MKDRLKDLIKLTTVGCLVWVAASLYYGWKKGGSVPALEISKQSDRKILFYRHPMRSDVSSPVPAKDEMGMDYIPVYEEGSVPAESDVPGRGVLALPKKRQEMIGVAVSTVESRDFNVEIKAAGTVALDKELFAAIQEYQATLKLQSQIHGKSSGDFRGDIDSLVDASRKRLTLLGLSSEEVAAIDKRTPYELISDSSVWIYAEVFPSDASLLSEGQDVQIINPAAPSKTIKGKIQGLSSVVSPETRTVRVRIKVINGLEDLRPDSFVNVKISINLGKKISVPEDAILHSGKTDYAFVVEGDTTFSPRRVKTGIQSGGFYEITEGLSEGQKVVTGANFLIDSESKLNAALSRQN